MVKEGFLGCNLLSRNDNFFQAVLDFGNFSPSPVQFDTSELLCFAVIEVVIFVRVDDI